MGRLWKLALGVVVVAAIAIWDIGLPGSHSAPPSAVGKAAPSASPSPTSTEPVIPDVPGVLHPSGSPDFAAAFTGSSLNTSVWDTCYPFYLFPGQRGCRNFGNPEESEWYLPSQDQVSDGLLHLVAKRERTEGTTPKDTPQSYDCRSGMITSYPGFRFKYGYLQIVADIPASTGLWPALWLRPITSFWKPEIDLVESWGSGSTEFAGTYLHAHPGRTVKKVYHPASQVAGWHTFALSWTRTQLTWMVDGKVTLTVTTHVPQQKMYLIANLAAYKPVGPQNPCAGELLIRSVDYWKA
jgi:beta-glucanase (GH16 family)